MSHGRSIGQGQVIQSKTVLWAGEVPHGKWRNERKNRNLDVEWPLMTWTNGSSDFCCGSSSVLSHHCIRTDNMLIIAMRPGFQCRAEHAPNKRTKLFLELLLFLNFPLASSTSILPVQILAPLLRWLLLVWRTHGSAHSGRGELRNQRFKLKKTENL